MPFVFATFSRPLGLVTIEASLGPPRAPSHHNRDRDRDHHHRTPRAAALLPQATAEQQSRPPVEPSPGGTVVIFDWVETLRDLLSRTDYDSAPAAAADSDGRSSPSSGSRVGGVGKGKGEEEEEEEEPLEAEVGFEEVMEIVHGQAFTDRKSTFQAHLARVSSESQVWDSDDHGKKVLRSSNRRGRQAPQNGKGQNNAIGAPVSCLWLCCRQVYAMCCLCHVLFIPCAIYAICCFATCPVVAFPDTPCEYVACAGEHPLRGGHI